MKIIKFTDLLVWQEGHKLILIIYILTNSFPREEKYSLVSQMKRSGISITSNIAEGFGRHSYKDKLRFYYIAEGSLTELLNQIILANDLHYLREEDFISAREQCVNVYKLLRGLIRKTKSYI